MIHVLPPYFLGKPAGAAAYLLVINKGIIGRIEDIAAAAGVLVVQPALSDKGMVRSPDVEAYNIVPDPRFPSEHKSIQEMRTWLDEAVRQARDRKPREVSG